MLVSSSPVSGIPVSAAPVPVVTGTVPYFDYVQTCFVITWTRPQIVAYQVR